MKSSILLRYTFLMFLLFTSAVFSQVKNSTSVIIKTDKTVNTYDNEKQKEDEKSELKIVFSDRADNNIYEEPYGAKVKNKVNILSPMYVINEDKNYYEVVVADKKLIGKPKGTFSVLRSKKNHFSNAKEVQYLGWIKKENVIEYSRARQNQVNLKYVKYFVASNTLENLFTSTNNVKKKSLLLKNDPNLESVSKKNIKLNDFVYVYKINKTTNAAFVSNFDDVMPKDTTNLKYGWIPLQYLNPIEDNMVVKLDAADTLKFSSGKINFRASELYKNTFFVNENQSSLPIKFDNVSKISLPINIWNHDKNKITNLRGDDISIKTIEQIALESKTINFFYVFENNNNTKSYLKKTLSALQNLKLTTSSDLYANYNFTYSFIAKGKPKSYYLIKSKSFSKWFDLIEKSIKTPQEISKENTLLSNNIDISQFLSSETNFENNFFILTGLDGSINSVLPDSFSILAKNNVKLLFILFGNENNSDNQDFILQSKLHLSDASSANKKNIQNYYVDPKLIAKNDEFTYNGEVDNEYIYNAPLKSNFNGGIIFPKLNSELTPETINKAIDSVVSKTIKTNNALLKSLTQYKNEFSFLRSQPSETIHNLIENSSQKDSVNAEIPKNYKSETFVINAKDTLSSSLEDKVNILLTEGEIKQLIENYRELISKEYTSDNIDKVEILNFKDRCKTFARKIKETEPLRARSSLADLMYYKTRVFVNSSELHEIRIKDIRKFKKKKDEFKALFMGLNAKVEVLEKMQRNNAFEVFDDESQTKYYYISKKLLL
ncbi:type VI secretion system protein TssR domain-containing protein [uncultured Flavobacterium sp.]|uniref:type VI secretion system protein TssR domain-containing protein n=1 Tax=uncultured Flavobacterium sp. TaxID=165435 RepID=UPI0029310FFE|nr:type VI secretion system protein TssR domain-containing protein [uncultured Flavobacterium sp.]